MAEGERVKPPVGSIGEQLAVFRALDALFGINQACSEAAHQLRIGHLYQLRKDRQSFRQKSAAIAVFLVTLIPSLSSLISVPILRVGWIIAVTFLAGLYLLAARDKVLRREILKEYEDIETFDRVVRSSQVSLLRDYIFGYCNRHELLYQMYPSANDFERIGLMDALDYYQGVFKKVKIDLLELRENKSRLLSEEDYGAIVGFIDFCEARYEKLKQRERKA
jgi:hypothetical protein